MVESPLRKARKAKGLTLADVAASVGIDVASLSRIENGKQSPGPDIAAALASYYEGSITELHILYPERYAPRRRAGGAR